MASPDLKRYMDKKLQIALNGNRNITGTLRGFDQFMNLVLDDVKQLENHDDEQTATTDNNMGMVVVRGNSVVSVEALERLWEPKQPKPH